MLTTVAAGRVFDYSYCIGMYSQSGRGFWAPQDFVLGATGRIYVLSRGAEQLGQRISKISFDNEVQGQFGSFGSEDGRFIWPRSIDIDQLGRVYVSDEYLNRISVFDSEGAFRYHWGRAGREDGPSDGGMYGTYPSLKPEHLTQGDLAPSYDFRGFYSTVIDRWLGLDPVPIVGGKFEELSFV